MIVYYLLPLISFLFFYLIEFLKKSSNKESIKYFDYFLYSLLLIIFIIIAGFREETISRDYENYVNFFDQIKNGETVSVINDPGFYFIIKIITLFSDKYAYLFLIYAILGVSMKFISIKRILGIQYACLAIAIYSANFFLFHEMTQIRIGVATGFFLFSIPYIINRQPIKYLITILLGSFFHVSLLIVLPLYFIDSQKIKPKFWIILNLINFLFFITHQSILKISTYITPPFFSEKIFVYKSFMEESNESSNIGIFNRFLVYFILNFVFLYHYKIIEKKSKYFIFLLKSSFISLSIAFFLYDFYLFAYRFSEIIGVVQICLFGMLTFLFKDKHFGNFLVLCLAILLIIVNVSLTHLVLPYKFISF